MTQHDSLARALSDLRATSNPSADQKARVLAAVLIDRSVPGTAGHRDPSGRAEQYEPRAISSAGLGKNPWLPRVVLSFALFGAGYSLGRNGSRHGPATRENNVAPASPTPELKPSPSPSSSAFEPTPTPELRALEAAPAKPAPSREPSPRPLVSGRSPRIQRSKLTLAEALRLLHRADRAIYSDQAAWALSLLDELDERAPRSMLREERVATRVLALCKDGQTERAESLAREAEAEAPSTIYGSLLERGCSPK